MELSKKTVRVITCSTKQKKKRKKREKKTNIGEWGGELRGSRLEAWMKSHKSEVAIT